VAEFFDALVIPEEPPALAESDRERLNVLAGLGAKCRSPVMRDRFKGDVIERVPAPEGPARLLGQLGQLAAGMRVIGVPEPEVWRLLAEVALDGMHPLRRKVLEVLIASDREISTGMVAARCSLPVTSVRRHLEALNAHGVLEKAHHEPEVWAVSEWTRGQWRAVSCESILFDLREE